MNKLIEYLCSKYCPSYFHKTPCYDDDIPYEIDIFVNHGYFGNKTTVIKSLIVAGIKQAYFVARWEALKADWRYPDWLYDCGINYGIREAKSE